MVVKKNAVSDMKKSLINKKITNKKRKKNKTRRGFTLIELLAVIVILGLLMAIAIPSVTRYITQSRKKTVVSSIDGYISAIANEVNDQDYKFTDSNKIFAVPIECISLEKGGTNPFGEWHQADDNYWAYVLIQYDSEEFSYNYGFTFKDSSGYGMYPTIQSEINPKSSDQIKTGLELIKPISGLYTNIAAKTNWFGFDIKEDTMVVVLESTEDTADGKYTCNLNQKGANYDEIKAQQKDQVIKTMSVSYNGSTLQYKFEEGMTWGEWLNSKYNTSTFHYSFENNRIHDSYNTSNSRFGFSLLYKCPVVTSIDQTYFSEETVLLNQNILANDVYYFLGNHELIPEYIWSEGLHEFDFYLFKNEDGMLEYREN